MQRSAHSDLESIHTVVSLDLFSFSTLHEKEVGSIIICDREG